MRQQRRLHPRDFVDLATLVIGRPVTDLPAAFKEDWKRFHLALPTAHPEIYRQVERGSGTGYREVRHADYELIVEIRREEAAARRRRT